MKQEGKELLLKDLCGRLPYGVKLWHESFENVIILHAIDATQFAVDISISNSNSSTTYWNSIEQVKPYLFPISSMTEEQSKIYHELIGGMFGTGVLVNLEILIDWLNENHFDYRGLIPMELAIDATNLGIYK